MLRLGYNQLCRLTNPRLAASSFSAQKTLADSAMSQRFLGTKVDKQFIPSDSEVEEGKVEIMVQQTEEEMMARETAADEDLTYS